MPETLEAEKANEAGTDSGEIEEGELFQVEGDIPEEDIAGEFDGMEDGIEAEVIVDSGGNPITWVEDGAGVEEGRPEEGHQLLGIAEEDPEGGKEPGEAESEEEHGKENDRIPEGIKGEPGTNGKDEGKGKEAAHEGFEENGADGGHGEQVDGKDDFFNEVLVGEDDDRRLSHGLGDEAHDGEADEDTEGEVVGTRVLHDPEVASHDHPEDEGEEPEKEERIEEDPDHSEPTALGLALNLADRETKEQVLVFKKASFARALLIISHLWPF